MTALAASLASLAAVCLASLAHAQPQQPQQPQQPVNLAFKCTLPSLPSLPLLPSQPAGSPADPPLTNIIVGPTFANASAPAQCFRFGQSFYVFEALPLSAASPTPASPAAPPTQQQPSAQVVPWKCNTGCPALLRDASAQCYSIAGLNKSCSVVPSSELPTLSDPTSVLFQVQDKLAGDYCFTRSIFEQPCSLASSSPSPPTSPVALVFDCLLSPPDIGSPQPSPTSASTVTAGAPPATATASAAPCSSRPILDQYFWMQPMNAFLFASDQCTTPLPGSSLNTTASSLPPAATDAERQAVRQAVRQACMSIGSPPAINPADPQQPPPSSVFTTIQARATLPPNADKYFGVFSLPVFVTLVILGVVALVGLAFGTTLLAKRFSGSTGGGWMGGGRRSSSNSDKYLLRPTIVELPPFQPVGMVVPHEQDLPSASQQQPYQQPFQHNQHAHEAPAAMPQQIIQPPQEHEQQQAAYQQPLQQRSLPPPAMTVHTSIDDPTLAVTRSDYFPRDTDELDFATGERVEIMTLWRHGLAKARNLTTGRIGFITLQTWRESVLGYPPPTDHFQHYA